MSDTVESNPLGASASSENCRFASHDEYIKWCEAMVTKIYYAQIAMNNQPIREVVEEIGRKLWLQEGVELFPYTNIQATKDNEQH